MKKLKILLSLFLLSIIISCSTENEQPVEDYNFQLSEKLMVKESTENISDLLFNMGVSKINVEYSDNRFLFKNETQKSFILNGKTLDLEDYDFILEKEFLYLKDFPDYKVSILNELPFFDTPLFKGFSENQEENIKDTKISLLLLYLNEIILDNDVKLSFKESLSYKTQGCSFWDTYTVYATGNSRSVAESDLQTEQLSYSDDLEGCTPYGGVDSSCLWENHGCVATQSYCCN